MKTLMMPVRSLPSTTPEARAKRHFRLFTRGLQYGAAITPALLFGLAATVVVGSALALTLAVMVGVAAAFVGALVFLVVSPEGNLLLLLLLSQLWLLYAPRGKTRDGQPDGGLTMKLRDREAVPPRHTLAA